MAEGAMCRRVFLEAGAMAPFLAAAAGLHACSPAPDAPASSDAPDSSPTEPDAGKSAEPAASPPDDFPGIPQTGMTTRVPDGYFEPCDKPGSVIEFQYDTVDRAGSGEPVSKTAYVYLPYGYEDGTARYDIVYLMHGWEGQAGEFFWLGGIKDVLDHMIANGVMLPFIAVSPTFYAPGAGTGMDETVDAFRAFHEEFAQDLMPALESEYRTYAEAATPEALAASRDHRVFGGFSFGAMTTWLEFYHDSDYIRYFLPMSCPFWVEGDYSDWDPADVCDQIEQVVAENDLEDRGYFVYAATGLLDYMYPEVDAQMSEMLARPEAFPAENVVYYLKEDGEHDFDAACEYLYNALPVMLPLPRGLRQLRQRAQGPDGQPAGEEAGITQDEDGAAAE